MADYGEAEDRAYAVACRAWQREEFLSWVQARTTGHAHGSPSNSCEQRDESLIIDRPATTQDCKRRYSIPFVNDAAYFTDLPPTEDDNAKLPIDALTTYVHSAQSPHRSFDIPNTDARELAFTASLRRQPRFEDSLESWSLLAQGDLLAAHEHANEEYPFVGPADLPRPVYRGLPYSSEFVWDVDGAEGWTNVDTGSDVGIHMLSPECSASLIEYNAQVDLLCGGGRVLFEVASHAATDPSTSPAYDTALSNPLRPDSAPDTPNPISPPSTSSPLPCLHASLAAEVCTCLHCIFSRISEAVESRRKRDDIDASPHTLPRKHIRLLDSAYQNDTSEPSASVFSGHRSVTPSTSHPPASSSPVTCRRASLGPDGCNCLHCIFSSISEAVESRRKRDANLDAASTNPNTVPRKRIRLADPLYYHDNPNEPSSSVYSGPRCVSLPDEHTLLLTASGAYIDPDAAHGECECECKCECECAIQAQLHKEVWGYAALSACVRCVKRAEGVFC